MWLKIKISQWNKNGVYIMRLKKITWLQACFLGNMKVIWCNSLGDSHFQTYVMNNVEIVIDYYLRITSHVSHAVTSCTHYTSYSLLNLVHEIQNYMFFDFDTKYIHWLNFGDKMCHNLVLKFWVENSCFWKFMESFSCITCHEKSFENWFYRKISGFSKKYVFLSLDWSNLFFDQLKKLSSQNLTFCLLRLMFERCSTDRNWKIFSF